MNVEAGISGIYLERAAMDELADNLKADGYEVERAARIGDVQVDLVARRDAETIYYEFKLAGTGPSDGWASQLAHVQRLARQNGASFRLVLVRPPRQMTIEVDGIERALRDALVARVPTEVADIAAYAEVDDVSGVDVTTIEVRGTRAEVRGDASLLVTLYSGDQEVVGSEAFPFEFSAELDLAEGSAEVRVLSVDTTSWYGPLDEDDDPESDDGDKTTPPF